jgi:hypothetical protein
MTTSLPLLLLDVDGPLNPWRAKPEKRPEGYQTLPDEARGVDRPEPGQAPVRR